jgi:hypothetical protein
VLIGAYLLMSVGSGLAIYACARENLSRRAASFAMAIFLILPYHRINQYQRGALAECLSFIWVPLILLFHDRLMALGRGGENRWALPLAGFAACYAAFLVSHPPTAYQFTLVFGVIYALTLAATGEWRKLLLSGAGVALALLLASTYFLPAAFEQNLIHSDDLAESWPYHESYVFDFGTRIYGHTRDDFIKRIDYIWALNTALVLIGAIILLIFGGRLIAGRENHRRMKIWVIAGIFASFLMTKASAPLGRLVPGIQIGVFSWRLLSVTTLIVALLAGAALEMALRANEAGRRRVALAPLGYAAIVLIGGVSLSLALVAGRCTAPRHSNRFRNTRITPPSRGARCVKCRTATGSRSRMEGEV